MTQRIHAQFSGYACVLLEKNNQVLLIKRSNTGWMDGYWSIPGGAMEHHEPILYAAAREAKEELAIDIDIQDLQLFHLTDIHRNNMKMVGFYFICKNWQGEPINNEPERHSQIGWFAIDNLPADITHYTQKVIRAYQSKVEISLIQE